MKWGNLDFWKSGEWQVVMEKLNDLRKKGPGHCPQRKCLFEVLRVVPFDAVRVAIIGQDPYPNPAHATGIAFGVPADTRPLPGSLNNIFRELDRDVPDSRLPDISLVNWCKQGVLLWNAYPSCEVGKPGSHRWPEWELLTQEIISKLAARGDVLFVGLGARAHSLLSSVTSCPVILTSHPSPLSVDKGRIPFRGSKIFSQINSLLRDKPIDWRL